MPAPAKPVHPQLTSHEMLHAAEVAELLRMPVSTVLDFARRGVIPGHKLGRCWIFLRDDIVASVREAPSGRGAAAWPPGAAAASASTADRRRRYPRPVPSPESAAQPKLFG